MNAITLDIQAVDVILVTMSSSTSNIEAVAPRRVRSRTRRLVDRYWHCVAAELEAGLIDDSGNTVPERGFDEGLAAYRDWCLRHPESRQHV
jgi:hypothetical protein